MYVSHKRIRFWEHQENTKKAATDQREKVFFVSQFIAVIGKQDELANLFPEGPVIQQFDNNQIFMVCTLIDHQEPKPQMEQQAAGE